MVAQDENGDGGYAVPMVIRENQLVLLGSKGENVALPLRGLDAVVALAPFKHVVKTGGSGSHSGTTKRSWRTATGAGVAVHKGASIGMGFQMTITYGVALLVADGRILHRLSGSYSTRDLQAAATALRLNYSPHRIEDNDALQSAPEVSSNTGAVLPNRRRRFVDITAKVAAGILGVALGLAVFFLVASATGSAEVGLTLGLVVGFPLYAWGGRLLAWWLRNRAARQVTAAQLRH